MDADPGRGDPGEGPRDIAGALPGQEARPP